MRTITTTLALVVLAFTAPLSMAAQNDAIDYGDNSSMFANDGECDDPRFTGPGTSDDLDYTSAGHDADDCRASVEKGARFWFDPVTVQRPDCGVEDFGTDGSEYANDGACDDPRYINIDTVSGDILMSGDLKNDASDCRDLCKAGRLISRPAK